jgi:hypothetical protein
MPPQTPPYLHRDVVEAIIAHMDDDARPAAAITCKEWRAALMAVDASGQ